MTCKVSFLVIAFFPHIESISLLRLLASARSSSNSCLSSALRLYLVRIRSIREDVWWISSTVSSIVTPDSVPRGPLVAIIARPATSTATAAQFTRRKKRRGFSLAHKFIDSIFSRKRNRIPTLSATERSLLPTASPYRIFQFRPKFLIIFIVVPSMFKVFVLDGFPSSNNQSVWIILRTLNGFQETGCHNRSPLHTTRPLYVLCPVIPKFL